MLLLPLDVSDCGVLVCGADVCYVVQAVLAGEKLAPALLHLGVDSSSSQPDGTAADDVAAGAALEEQ